MHINNNGAQGASYTRLNSLMPPRPSQTRSKIVLAPGHSPLDWAALMAKASPQDLRGVSANTPPASCVRITRSELRQHNNKQDCWTAINGKVFNLTPYIDFHPGGEKEIMKCAGKDGTSLFNKYHSWVNPNRLLEKCIVGILVDSV